MGMFAELLVAVNELNAVKNESVQLIAEHTQLMTEQAQALKAQNDAVNELAVQVNEWADVTASFRHLAHEFIKLEQADWELRCKQLDEVRQLNKLKQVQLCALIDTVKQDTPKSVDEMDKSVANSRLKDGTLNELDRSRDKDHTEFYQSLSNRIVGE